MEHLIRFLLQSGLKPFSIDPAINELEKNLTRSELLALILIRFKKQITMSQLASDLGVPLSTVTNIGQRLKRRGLIERQRDPKDRRSILVSLTSEGMELANQMMIVLNRLIQRVEAALTPEELNQLIQLGMKALKAIQTVETGGEKEQARLRKIQISD
ncbi:MarR family winged helix-turn-helix transcriptional regulator [Thermoflavimicrobium daqui]|uniref:Transcriptional regulator n=1 Tax=Thermoflavimicrobium daqui TaxID=2137476 RepID=A0A364K8B6_9BACL|nr:MarR family transcriptional regulator [Thermoflavimicrobium daqui]RAL26440.1 transcriptional regulator [Thermoflavimicrobium daqui]